MSMETEWNPIWYFAASDLFKCLCVEYDKEGMLIRMHVENGTQHHALIIFRCTKNVFSLFSSPSSSSVAPGLATNTGSAQVCCSWSLFH
jgi:hypothetical protein